MNVAAAQPNAPGVAPPEAFLTKLFGNGAVETGNSAGIERYLEETDGAVKGKTAKGTFAATLADIIDDGADPSRLELAIAGAACLAHTGLFGEVNNWFAATDATFDDASFDALQITDEEFDSILRDAIALVAAAKVNWWKCNHHTGGNKATGFVARWLKLIDVTANNITEDITKLCWRAGHWFSTKSWLVALGVPGITDAAGSALSKRLAVDDAIAKRIRSGPAGTAAFEAVIAGLSAVAAHPIVGYAAAPQLPEWGAWKAARNALEANPARHHIGSQYLTGAPRIVLPVLPDPVISFVATAIRFYNRDASILNAAVFKNVTDDNTALAAFRSASTFETKERAHEGIAMWLAADNRTGK